MCGTSMGGVGRGECGVWCGGGGGGGGRGWLTLFVYVYVDSVYKTLLVVCPLLKGSLLGMGIRL